MTGRLRRLFWPSLMTAVMLIVLLGLGSWQVKRLFWKQEILAQIEHAEAAPPIPLPPSGTLSPFLKVSASGTFLNDATALFGAEVRDTRSGPQMGAHLIEPMRETNGDVILIDRGWIPVSRPEPLPQPAGVVTIAGYIRSGDTPGWFSARDDVPGRRFFTLDPKTIGNAVGQPGSRPFILVALVPGPDETIVTQIPDPARHLPRPPNNHLSYAITWYGLAVSLMAIFIVWARKGSLA